MNNSGLRRIVFGVVTACVLWTQAIGLHALEPTDVSVTGNARKDAYVNGIVYQTSAEFRAIQKQAYDLATLRLDQALAHKEQYDKPLAIISDIDLTIMDDTTFQAEMMKKEYPFDDGPYTYYYNGVATTADHPMPGALAFFKHAADNGVEVFYITNRAYDTKDLAVAQLKHWGFPNADDAHVQVMNKERTFDKAHRRANVMKDYDVVLLLGDNMADFTSDFRKDLGPIERTALLDKDPQYYDKIGMQWIVFPNATYGDWYRAVWYDKKDVTPQERTERTREVLDYYGFTNPQWDTWYDGPIKNELPNLPRH